MDATERGLTELLQSGIEEKVFPGAACAFGVDDHTYFATAGHHTYNENSKPITQHTMWDLASVTKVTATTSIALTLYQEGVLDLDAHVQHLIGEFEGGAKDEVRVRNLLLHDSGLPPYRNLTKYRVPKDARHELFCTELSADPTEKTAYSCLGFVTLMEYMERLTGDPMERLLHERVTGPLGMVDTTYNPIYDQRKECSPTEQYDDWRFGLENERGFKRVQNEFIQGAVHDPIAYIIGGVSGNAGLFSKITDMAKIARAWMEASGPFVREAMDLFSAKQEEKSTRGLGFDTKSPKGASSGTKFSMKTFGHTGFTGTCVWVDPVERRFMVLLGNRVHPTSENGKISQFRPRFHDAAVELLS